MTLREKRKVEISINSGRVTSFKVGGKELNDVIQSFELSQFAVDNPKLTVTIPVIDVDVCLDAEVETVSQKKDGDS